MDGGESVFVFFITRTKVKKEPTNSIDHSNGVVILTGVKYWAHRNLETAAITVWAWFFSLCEIFVSQKFRNSDNHSWGVVFLICVKYSDHRNSGTAAITVRV